MSTIVYTVSVNLDQAGKFERMVGELGRISAKRFGNARGNGHSVATNGSSQRIAKRKGGYTGVTRTRLTVEKVREVLNLCERPAGEIGRRTGLSSSSVHRLLAGQHVMAKKVLAEDKVLANKLTLVRYKLQH